MVNGSSTTMPVFSVLLNPQVCMNGSKTLTTLRVSGLNQSDVSYMNALLNQSEAEPLQNQPIHLINCKLSLLSMMTISQ